MDSSSKIFLIGFMGSGKTTLGKKLANKLNKTFFDLDAEIERVEGESISEIFQNKGESFFREIETKVLKEVILKNENIVLSLGGGTPCFNDNMSLINQSGKSIYLKYNSGILASRLLNSKTKRPLVEGKSEDELKSYIETTLKQREDFYNQSNVIVEANNLKVEDFLLSVQ